MPIPAGILHADVVGISNHLSSELFKLMSATRMSFVPYKAVQQAITEMIRRQVQPVQENIAALSQHA